MISEGIIGQNRALDLLRSDIENDRTAHSYIFTGPVGSGRVVMAKNFFRALNCKSYLRVGKCDGCISCRKILKEEHEDLFILDPLKNRDSFQIKIDEVRAVVRKISFLPYCGGMRLFLIRDAEHLNLRSSNFLLKVLEEPPLNNLIILTVRDVGSLLPTLVSRCRKIALVSLSIKTIIEELLKCGVSREVAELKALLSGGSFGKALEIDEVNIIENLRLICKEIRKCKEGVIIWDFWEKIFEDFKKSLITRKDIVNLLELMMFFFREQAFQAVNIYKKSFLLSKVEIDFKLNMKESIESFFLVKDIKFQILRNVSPATALSFLMIKLKSIYC